MDIHSPDDCFVLQVFTRTGQVRKGDSLIELYCPELEQKLDRIEKFLKILEINKRQYTDGRLQAEKKSEDKLLASIRDIDKSNNDVYDNVKEEEQVLGDVAPAMKHFKNLNVPFILTEVGQQRFNTLIRLGYSFLHQFKYNLTAKNELLPSAAFIMVKN